MAKCGNSYFLSHTRIWYNNVLRVRVSLHFAASGSWLSFFAVLRDEATSLYCLITPTSEFALYSPEGE